jgi:Zn-dependent M28 family amino/carboxypeptidase
MKIPYYLLLPALALGGACDPKSEPEDLSQLLELVAGDSLSAHIKYLASDELKGRLPGTPEYGLAIDYVIGKFKEMEIEPAGEKGEYIQMLTIRNSRISEGNSFMEWNGKMLSANEDYYFIGNLNEVTSELPETEIVFAGYGINAPNYDDFSLVDVENKVILVLIGSPESLQSSERAHFSNWETKYRTAADKGVVGILFINSNPSVDSTFAARANSASQRGVFGVTREDGEAFGRRAFPGKLRFSALLNSASMASKELNAAITDYKENKIVGQSIGSIRVKTESIFSEFQSANIVGKIEGSDNTLKKEYVIHTAHLDHVGIGKPVEGDSIYNGAHDNASGVASLLEIARLYQSLERKPKRSILFVRVTAEEMGLLGSDYFTTYPTVPIESIVANVNTDMPTLIAPLLSIEPLGAEHSTIMNEVKNAAEILSLEIMPDHMPDEVRFVRSDQYNFIKKGIPALHVKYGLKSTNPDEDLSKAIRNYTRNVYHKPSDEWNDLFDFEAGEVYVKCNFLISYFIANNAERPAWNTDSFFNPLNQR